MDSFNVTCSLTGKVISKNSEIIIVLLTPREKNNALSISSGDDYAPLPIVFEGKYNSYGRLEDTKLFQNEEVLTDKQMEMAEKYIFKQLKANTCADYNSYNNHEPENLNELMRGSKWGMIKQDMTLNMFKKLVELSSEIGSENTLNSINRYKKIFGTLNSIDEVREKIDELEKKQKINITPIKFIYFEKKSYLTVINDYGTMQDNLDEDALSGDVKNEITKVLDRDAIKRLEKMHIEDLTAVNNYFSMIGKSWMPSMAINEEIEIYDNKEALNFQRDLLIVKPNKKNKP